MYAPCLRSGSAELSSPALRDLLWMEVGNVRTVARHVRNVVYRLMYQQNNIQIRVKQIFVVKQSNESESNSVPLKLIETNYSVNTHNASEG